MVQEVDCHVTHMGKSFSCDSYLSHCWGLSVTHHVKKAGNTGSTVIIQ